MNDHIKQMSSHLGESKDMLDKRMNALKHFTQTNKYGKGILVDLDLDLSHLNLLEDKTHFNVEGDVNVISLTEETIKEYFDESTFLSGLFNQGTLITVSKRNTGEIHLTLKLDGTHVDYIVILVEENAKAKIIETIEGKGVRGQVVIIVIKENAEIEYSTSNYLDNDTPSFTHRKVYVGKNSLFKFTERLEGGKFNQSINTFYLEEKSTLQSSTYTKGKKSQLFDLYTHVIHLGEKSESSLINKATLDEDAREVYRGLIKINEGIKHCKGNQRSDTLLLSKDARADSIPSLEIENDHVRCNHAVTISKVSEDTLFYMMSRGITESDAKKEIIKGFLHEN